MIRKNKVAQLAHKRQNGQGLMHTAQRQAAKTKMRAERRTSKIPVRLEEAEFIVKFVLMKAESLSAWKKLK